MLDHSAVAKPLNRPFTLYLDETGNRHPDKKADASRIGRDWFGFGGVLVRGEDNDKARSLVDDFSSKWRLRGPAHLTDMRAEKKAFSWLERASGTQRSEFWRDWERVLCEAPVFGVGCIIDRPGYVARGYLNKHPDRWLLCRSAFDITVERCSKIASHEERKLHVVFEQDAAINKIVTGYFDNLKSNGMGFNQENSKYYNPLGSDQFSSILGRIQHKPKENQILQIADSYIYSIARAGYDKKFWLYRSLKEAGKISDECFAYVDGNVGIKYYCFDHKTKKPG